MHVGSCAVRSDDHSSGQASLGLAEPTPNSLSHMDLPQTDLQDTIMFLRYTFAFFGGIAAGVVGLKGLYVFLG